MPRITTSTSQAAPAVQAPGDDWALLDAFNDDVVSTALARQQAFLAVNPEWAPCVYPGCTGTVAPDKRPDGSYVYIREVNGVRTGKCPRTRAHAALEAQRGQRGQTGRTFNVPR